MPLTVERCRELLGESAENMTDEDIIAVHDDMAKMAHIVYDQLVDAMRHDPIEPDDSQFARDLGMDHITERQLRQERIEDVLWTAHAHKTGEYE